jgi:lipoprotein-anchoring transpeptidase ErfK/SrfK
MRRLIYCLAAFAVLVLSHHAARAGVAVRIDKLAQRMIVSVDGQPAYVWPVSTGRGGFGTPVGRFRPQWLARSWFSTKYYGSPMPHSIFFHKGYAIHGTNYISRLGGPASHGCVRLHPANAAKLFALVQRAGLANTSIVISGADPVLAKRRARSAQATY